MNRGILQLSLKPVVLSAEFVADKPEIKPGSFVKLTVRDSGQGMDETTMSRIFDPYFTTKEQGAGTGLGLAVIHGIVEECKGFIEVESVDRARDSLSRLSADPEERKKRKRPRRRLLAHRFREVTNESSLLMMRWTLPVSAIPY